ncbi:hypothetical protein [Ruegeria sp. HKCCD6428]|uniref:hypothetical protein n=1 Tax=Ruegeria sp. HKCCD6428 TaxID=2683002 RepID=UPI0014916AA9|nr:hypothetical protein [Ruegeria sp. HKCCD6428]NOC83497.1 hypothetical protein [Ruegeria sp. HKCCD6428]
MTNEIEAKIAELNYKTALANQDAANKQRASGLMQYVVGGAITAALAAWASYQASTYSYNSTLRELELKYAKENREIDLELAKLSLTILAGDYQEDVENSLPARMFALNALERGTGVLIPDEDKKTWAETGLTPVDMFGFGEIQLENQIGIANSSLKQLMVDALTKKTHGCIIHKEKEHCGELFEASIVGNMACLMSERTEKLVCGELRQSE